jgi:hypothetical protein
MVDESVGEAVEEISEGARLAQEAEKRKADTAARQAKLEEERFEEEKRMNAAAQSRQDTHDAMAKEKYEEWQRSRDLGHASEKEASDKAIAAEKKARSDATKAKIGRGYRTAVGDNGPASLIILLLALAIHFYHGFFHGFAPIWSLLVPVYLVFAIAMAVVMTLTGEGENRFVQFFRNLMMGVLVCAIILAVIYALTYASNNFANPFIEDYSGFLLFLFPPLAYFIIFSPDFSTPPWAQNVAAILIIIFAIGFVLAFVGNVSLPIPDNYQGIDAKQGFLNTMNRLWDGVVAFAQGAYTAYNETTARLDPNYYVGKVEGSQTRELGVRLEEVGPIDSSFSPGQPISIFGYIAAETFLDDKISVATSCYSTKGDGAEVHVAPVDVYYGHDQLFECTFKDTFTPGVYPIEVHAGFPFETWADITYDFVLEEKSLQFARLQRDIYRELDITLKPQSIYTPGPVMLGMGGSRMPILVTKEEPYLENAVLGFTLQSTWSGGKLGEVEELELKVPKEFVLTKCDRDGDVTPVAMTDEILESYDRYVFTNKVDGSPYTSIRCTMGLKSKDTLPDLTANDKISRTFIARAKYHYTIVGKTSVRVSE